MKNLTAKFSTLRQAINNTELPRSQYKNRPLGCPMYKMMDSRLTAQFGKEELQKAFVLGLIGNEGREGSIIANCKDLDENDTRPTVYEFENGEIRFTWCKNEKRTMEQTLILWGLKGIGYKLRFATDEEIKNETARLGSIEQEYEEACSGNIKETYKCPSTGIIHNLSGQPLS